MKKIILITLLLIFVGFLATKIDILHIFSSSTAYAVGDLTIDWGVPSGQPIFTFNNMKPGDIETHTVSVHNNATSVKPVGVRSLLTSETGSMSGALSIVISHAGTDVYGGTSGTGSKTLAQFFTDSMSEDGISLSHLNPGQSTAYTFTVTFLPSSGNKFQNKKVTFDIQMGISVPIPTQCLGMKFTHMIFGTNGNDVINGPSGSTLIFDFDGNNTIHGGSGTTCIVSGNGNSKLYGGTGVTVIVAGNGNNLLFGGSGNNTLISGGNSTATGGTGINKCKAKTEIRCQIHL